MMHVSLDFRNIQNKKNNKYCMKDKIRKNTNKIIKVFFRTFFILGFCFVILYPVFTMIMKSFMSRTDLFDNSVIQIPRHFTLENIKVAGILLDYGNSFRNTLLLAVLVTATETFICLLVGYGFGRYKFPFKNALFAILIFTIIVPPQLIMIPVYMQFRNFDPLNIFSLLNIKNINLIDTPWPFIFLAVTGMYTKNGLFIYMFRQFFQSVPNELEEAAYIDGAGSLETFFKIMLPNAKTVITTVVLFGFVWQYNDVTYSKIFFSTTHVFATVYENLGRFTNEIYELLGTSQYDITMDLYSALVRNTGVMMITAPLLIVFLLAQNFFVDSIERSGIVG